MASHSHHSNNSTSLLNKRISSNAWPEKSRLWNGDEGARKRGERAGQSKATIWTPAKERKAMPRTTMMMTTVQVHALCAFACVVAAPCLKKTWNRWLPHGRPEARPVVKAEQVGRVEVAKRAGLRSHRRVPRQRRTQRPRVAIECFLPSERPVGIHSSSSFFYFLMRKLPLFNTSHLVEICCVMVGDECTSFRALVPLGASARNGARRSKQ
jgi:hypothetical protein